MKSNHDYIRGGFPAFSFIKNLSNRLFIILMFMFLFFAGGEILNTFDIYGSTANALEVLCADGEDNDGDGFTDCFDTDCDFSPDCESTNNDDIAGICEDTLDNDMDVDTDCADRGCDLFVSTTDEANNSCEGAVESTRDDQCSDGDDNDLDGAIDCEDTGCDFYEGRLDLLEPSEGCEGQNTILNGVNLADNLAEVTDCLLGLDLTCAIGSLTDVAQEDVLAVINQCNDGVDNDGDGRADCADPGCQQPSEDLINLILAAGLQLQTCENCQQQGDEDNDGFADCSDIDCLFQTGPNNEVCTPGFETICDDGFDNDGDTLADCADPDCDGQTGPGGITCDSGDQEVCDDETDNDNDGLVDCQDPDCDGETGPGGVTCESGSEMDCDDSLDNDGDGLVDCQDPDCDNAANCENSEAECSDGEDNDGDQKTDCFDPGCFDTDVCVSQQTDLDGDGVPNQEDNCPAIPNPGQEDENGFMDGSGAGDACEFINDLDGDGVTDGVDNCPTIPNPDQEDSNGFQDGDGIGDACEGDLDSDDVPDALDNCPFTPNPDQMDTDGDGIGDACEGDLDGDGIPDFVDSCVNVPNTGMDSDGDGIDNACDNDDSDFDGVNNQEDNCPFTPNPDQADSDGDGIGDACEGDFDGDGARDDEDNCPNVPNPDQTDTDGNGIGDACDLNDIDGDNTPNAADNCPLTPNPGQEDADGDGIGDACDEDFNLGEGIVDVVLSPDQTVGDAVLRFIVPGSPIQNAVVDFDFSNPVEIDGFAVLNVPGTCAAGLGDDPGGLISRIEDTDGRCTIPSLTNGTELSMNFCALERAEFVSVIVEVESPSFAGQRFTKIINITRDGLDCDSSSCSIASTGSTRDLMNNVLIFLLIPAFILIRRKFSSQ